MSGLLLIIIGHTGQGKTTLVREMVKDHPSFIFDVQNQGDYSWCELNEPSARCSTFTGGHAEFIEYAQQRTNTNIVFEEATVFLEGKTAEGIRQIMVDKRHKKNNLLFLFHSINSVPPRIFEMADTIILFKTGDELLQVKRKRASLVNPFLALKKSPKYSKVIIDNIEMKMKLILPNGKKQEFRTDGQLL